METFQASTYVAKVLDYWTSHETHNFHGSVSARVIGQVALASSSKQEQLEATMMTRLSYADATPIPDC